MAKNKKKNKSGNKQKPAVSTTSINTNQGSKPPIVKEPVSATLKIKEVEQSTNEAITNVEKYCAEQKKAADKYYDERKVEADSLEKKKEEEIKREVALTVKEKEREMAKDIQDAKNKAKKIVDDAEREAREKNESLTVKQDEFNKRSEEHTKQMATLESSKLTYKQEILDSIRSEMKTIKDEKVKLETENYDLKKVISKKETDIRALEEEKSYYEEQLSANGVKKAEILSYKIKINEQQSNYAELEKLYKEQQKDNNTLKAQILLYGDNPQKALRDNEDLVKKNIELHNQIVNCPSAEEIAKLRENSKKFEEVSNKLGIANSEKAKFEDENNNLKVEKYEIESYRKFVKILELQKAELQRELDRSIELYNRSTGKVFSSLSLIDIKPCDDYPSMLPDITLKQLCDKFRGYLANRSETPLYYDDKTIRTFIAGFASSRLMILEGLSGTGKSSLPRSFQDFLGAKTIEVPVQSSWKDRNDLLGFYNDFKKQYKETEFLKALYQATHDQNNIYIIVLDEMNLSRMEYYFADLLSVLEKPRVDDWKIELISDYANISQNQDAWPKLIHEGKLQIGDNTWFVGTANKDDSTFIITDKVYDRSVVLNFDKKGEKEKVDSSTPITPIKLNNYDFQKLLKAASKFKDTKEKDYLRFRSMITNLDEKVKEMFQITFGNRISNQLETFVPVYIECGGTVDEAVDIMFSRKILRKLEGIYDEDAKVNLDMLREEIENKNYDMGITIEAIKRMVRKI